MSELNILEISKQYNVEFECPKCEELSQDICIDCTRVKCRNCGSEFELDYEDLGQCE